ncbi:cytochrome P450 [Roridomyces roridus]|uniref:Cytochrome P450 n=1 Tax=Roridomyces roridus TaxID=1738132 RepID=A0AAD7BZD5_9AGAR|nr:cytochrome P450 [Roridomyces roridus]
MATSMLPTVLNPHFLSAIMEVKPATAILLTLGLFALRRIFTLWKAFRSPTFFPRVYTPFYPFKLPGAVLPTTAWTTGADWHWVRRFQTYARGETVSVFPIIAGTPRLWTSNINIGRQVAAGGHRSNFIKPEDASRFLRIWGMNLVAADGLMWRKHRRIVGSAFGIDLYKLVWKQTSQLYKEMVEVEGWKDKNVVDIPIIQRVTAKLAFLVISTCGFGFASSWATPPKAADGGTSMQESLTILSENFWTLVMAPKWLMYLPIPNSMIRKTFVAKERVANFMQDQIVERKAQVASGSETSSDAFTTLVKANMNESGKYQLDDQELVGNVFVLMFAGHETTAHTLAATLCFMAIHQEIQDEVVEQINSVVGFERDPDFNDYTKLDKVLAIFYEASRMFPSGHVVMREAAEDTVLTIPNPVGEEGSKTIPIPKGSEVIVDMVGVQHNPRYFEDPHIYKPSRWYGLPTDSELFTAFSVGPRACIGRRFATVEATCFLAHLLRDWRAEPLLSEGETKQDWAAHMDAKISVTLGLKDIPLRLARRR